jgi:DNA-directed RNA polymerase specialized sigma24 family protein
MGYDRPEGVPADDGGPAFTTTHWSVVLQAGGAPSPQNEAALEQLCRIYWYPLYAYVRRRGCLPEDAKDLVQGFFLHLLRGEILAGVRREGGRFRSFLLVTLKHYLSDQRDKALAQKRGGGRQIVSWDAAQAEQRFLREPVDAQSPDLLFERNWALTLLERALARLREMCESEGKGELFAHLKGFILGEKGIKSYAAAAAELQLTDSAFKTALFRLRRRYHELVRDEVRETVAEPKEAEEELRHLLTLFTAA